MSRSSLIEGLLVTLVVTGDFKGLVPPDEISVEELTQYRERPLDT